jgi:hypothetical protein
MFFRAPDRRGAASTAELEIADPGQARALLPREASSGIVTVHAVQGRDCERNHLTGAVPANGVRLFNDWSLQYDIIYREIYFCVRRAWISWVGHDHFGNRGGLGVRCSLVSTLRCDHSKHDSRKTKPASKMRTTGNVKHSWTATGMIVQ